MKRGHGRADYLLYVAAPSGPSKSRSAAAAGTWTSPPIVRSVSSTAIR
jgi:hypothetical protein